MDLVLLCEWEMHSVCIMQCNAMQCNAMQEKVPATPEFGDEKIDRTTSVELKSFSRFRLNLLMFIIHTHAHYTSDLSSLNQSYDILRHQLLDG
jgi:hypothetical protein